MLRHKKRFIFKIVVSNNYNTKKNAPLIVIVNFTVIEIKKHLKTHIYLKTNYPQPNI